jgi:hypothetical protein
MGLGIAIAGGIICATVLAVFSIVFSTSEQIYEINSSRTHAADLQGIAFQTSMTLSDLTAASGSRYVNFTLTNTGNEKLWNYGKFNVIINYTADVLGVPTQRTESITYTTNSDEITIDAVSNNAQTCSTCNLSHTVAGTNKLLIVGVSIGDDSAVSTVTYSGQSLTLIRFDEVTTTDRRSELWYLVNPPSGTADVVVTLDKNEQIVIGAISFTNVHQSGPINADNGDTDLTDTTHPSVSLTTTIDNALIVDVVSAVNGPMTPSAYQTERWDLNRGQLVGSGSTNQTTTANTYTMSWTNDGGLDQWAMSAAAIRPADPACGPSGSIATNNWLLNSVSNDYTDPNIINTNEGALICTKLAYPVYTNGDVKVTVSTDSGYTKTNSTTAT